MPTPNEQQDRAFFGRRKAKPLKPRQQAAYDRLLPRLNIDVSSPFSQPLAKLFDSVPEQICLEIGFGGGEHLVHQAICAPQDGFIGVEPFINGMAKLLVAVNDNAIENIRVFDADAVHLLNWLPAESLARIDLLYPDPWPKRRHWKRRFVNQENLDRFARALRPGGRFRFASDIGNYVNWTLRHVRQQGDFHWTAQSAGDWKQPWDGWNRTRYETKAIREGRQPAYLVFEKRV